MTTTARGIRQWHWSRGAHRVHALRSSDPLPALPGRGERVLLREATPDGGELVVTNHALHFCGGTSGDGCWQRIEWTEIRSVARSGQRQKASVMTVRLRTPPSQRLSKTFRVQQRSRVPDLASHLVNAAVVVSRRILMSNSSTVTFLARRNAETAEITWTVELERVSDQLDPSLGSEIAATLRSIRAQTGC